MSQQNNQALKLCCQTDKCTYRSCLSGDTNLAMIRPITMEMATPSMSSLIYILLSVVKVIEGGTGGCYLMRSLAIK